ncbi:hypothetical protein QBC43DRAFT_205478 [Cladorrhinum sp. PSN259]|nr:hypothetical protein QBC43DRAFT_205478 [Cladorrhinum sp. PSN259]
MSGRGRGGRGGRGGFRGGRPTNGVRNVTREAVPFSIDTEIDTAFDGKPTELFPAYDVPKPPTLNKKEDRQVHNFLIFREQCHDSPLYTQARTWDKVMTGAGKRAYGQEQINKRYKDDNMIDPFTAVPTYSSQFEVVARTLPDLSSRPFVKEFFPPELHATLDGNNNKRRKVAKSLGLSKITSYKTAEDLEAEQLAASRAGGAAENYDKALELLKNAENAVEEGGLLLAEEDDDWVRNNGDDEDGEGEQNVEEDEYDDESGDDYNAEQYFEEGDNDDDDDGGGDDGAYMD